MALRPAILSGVAGVGQIGEAADVRAAFNHRTGVPRTAVPVDELELLDGPHAVDVVLAARRRLPGDRRAVFRAPAVVRKPYRHGVGKEGIQGKQNLSAVCAVVLGQLQRGIGAGGGNTVGIQSPLLIQTEGPVGVEHKLLVLSLRALALLRQHLIYAPFILRGFPVHGELRPSPAIR